MSSHSSSVDPNKPNKPSNSAFAQQRLKGWRFHPSDITLGSIYFSIGLVFIICGSLILAESHDVLEHEERYDDIVECKANWRAPPTCIVPITITSTMTSPVFLYYEIRGMYQNHRQYYKSRDAYQLMGDDRAKHDIRDYCDPIVDLEDLGLITTLNLDEDEAANPCGLTARSLFNDTFTLIGPKFFEIIQLKEEGISWRVDRDEKFSRNGDYEEVQWTDVEDGKA
jgi:hypothetical protein